MPLRAIVIALILVTAAALGTIAYQLATPPQPVVLAAPPAPPTAGYLVAARELPAGTLLRDQDFTGNPAPGSTMPDGALVDRPEVRASLRGALLRRYVEAGAPVTAGDVLRSHDRGFLATVLAPGTRAVTIGVDQVSGVAGLIWPGDLVDVILTQEFDPAQVSLAKRVLSETVLTGLRVIAVDQDIVQGGSSAGTAGRATKTVTVQASADEAERLTVAQHLGHLALAVRAVVDAPASEQTVVYGGDVSPAMAHAMQTGGTRIQVIEGEHRSEVTFQ